MVLVPYMEDFSFDHDPGLKFLPTDEEIITYYLSRKILDDRYTTAAIGEVDFNNCEPWDLPGKTKMGVTEWYFFSRKQRKYKSGTGINRMTPTGFWKSSGKEKEIFKGTGVLVGMKKTLVFYIGKVNKGLKTDWVMQEFRIEPSQTNIPRTEQDEWVVCKVYHKKQREKINGLEGMNFGNKSETKLPTLPAPVKASINNSGSTSSNNISNIGGTEDKDSSTPFPSDLHKDLKSKGDRETSIGGDASMGTMGLSIGMDSMISTLVPNKDVDGTYSIELDDIVISIDPAINLDNLFMCP